jgi:hypothetical protein
MSIFKFLIGILLFVVSVVLYFVLTIINFFLVRSKDYFLDTAATVDRYGNRDLRKLWNSTLIRKESQHHFGNIDETISSVLGKNQREKTLTYTGKFLAWILDTIDKDHCKKSINE